MHMIVVVRYLNPRSLNIHSHTNLINLISRRKSEISASVRSLWLNISCFNATSRDSPVLQSHNHNSANQSINQSIKSHTREESSRHTRHWSTLLSTQRQNRHDRVLRQLESHSKECVESLDRFLIGPNHHHHQFKPSSSKLLCQNPSSIKFFKRSIDSRSRSVKRTRLLLNPISNHQSNPIESVVMIFHPCERASKRVRERTLKRKVDLCQVWNLGRLPQEPSSTTIHIPSDHSSNQSKQQHEQDHKQ